MSADDPFRTWSHSDLCALVRELRIVAERERRRATSLERALELEREATRRAWLIAFAGS